MGSYIGSQTVKKAWFFRVRMFSGPGVPGLQVTVKFWYKHLRLEVILGAGFTLRSPPRPVQLNIQSATKTLNKPSMQALHLHVVK